MNTFNRILVVIACFVLIVFLTALFIFPQVILIGLGTWLVAWGEYLAVQSPWARIAVGALLALIVDILLVFIIYLELRRSRKRFIRVQQVSGGMANISTESVTQLLEHKLDPQPGVIEVHPHVRARGNRVQATVDVGVTPETDVPHIASRLIRITQETLTEELGLRIAGQPEVRVTVVGEREEEQDVPERPSRSEIFVEEAQVPPVPPSEEDVEVDVEPVPEEELKEETETEPEEFDRT